MLTAASRQLPRNCVLGAQSRLAGGRECRPARAHSGRLQFTSHWRDCRSLPDAVARHSFASCRRPSNVIRYADATASMSLLRHAGRATELEHRDDVGFDPPASTARPFGWSACASAWPRWKACSISTVARRGHANQCHLPCRNRKSPMTPIISPTTTPVSHRPQADARILRRHSGRRRDGQCRTNAGRARAVEAIC